MRFLKKHIVAIIIALAAFGSIPFQHSAASLSNHHHQKP